MAEGQGVETTELVRRLPRGPLRGRRAKMLTIFPQVPRAADILSASKLVSAHTDLNLSNLILDDEGQPGTIDFDFRRIQLLIRRFDALILTRQCVADFFMKGELDSELARFFGDMSGSLDNSLNLIGRQREAIFDFAGILLAPKLKTFPTVFPKFW